jgi:oligoendopeptidase F
MPAKLPTTPEELAAFTWKEIEPRYRLLVKREVTAANVDMWLAEWSRLSEVVYEQNNQLAVAVTTNTADKEADKRYQENIDTILTPSRPYEQKLKEKLLASGLTPKGMGIPLRAMRAEAELYREANLPLLAEEQKLNNEYDDITGAQTVQWNGEELTFTEIQKNLIEENDRAAREGAWRAVRERMLADAPAIHDLWRKLFPLRQQIAANAGLPEYRAYAWIQKARFDYTPKDCKIFHTSIEKVVVPAATRVIERRRQKMGLESVRPWDEFVDPLARPALRPFRRISQLTSGAAKIFERVDPSLGKYFRAMVDEDLLDLKSRKNKAEGAYCTIFEMSHKPFILMNAVGIHYDVQTLLHESGHAFHGFETANLPYLAQRNAPMEFNEIASLAMELLAAPYLTDSGLYAPAEAARARIESIEDIILSWPYMALVDSFQHWMYENPIKGADPKKCDAKWSKLFARFIPGINYEGIEKYLPTHWHHQGHIIQSPFYYIEYGIAQLGAAQIWANALRNQTAAVEAYRKALALGSTASLPDLFAAAGAKLAFDRKTLQSAVDLIESQIAELEKVVG